MTIFEGFTPLKAFLFSTLVTNLFQHGFKGVKPSKMVGFEIFKDPNDTI